MQEHRVSNCLCNKLILLMKEKEKKKHKHKLCFERIGLTNEISRKIQQKQC